MIAATAMAAPAAQPRASAWLFSPSTDLWIFLGPAIAALVLVAVGFATGDAPGDTPPVLWLATVLLVDVAHVWSTTYRVYTDRTEVLRRPVLYLGTPAIVFAAGVALYASGALVFWRILAYGAVFHFVRQQYGWMMLYRRRAGLCDRTGRVIDGAAIYLATLYPLVWWHSAPARQFHWFVPGDFAIGLPPWIARVTGVLEAMALAVYAVRATREAIKGHPILWGKHLLLSTTALCWYAGIVAFDSDYVFTVTNVLIHGVPYFALVWREANGRYADNDGPIGRLFRLGWPGFYMTLVAAAFLEEGCWDALVWHDHPQFFGDWSFAWAKHAAIWIVPLLAVPQAVHYVLDGFVWRVGRKNPGLRENLALG